MKKLILFTGLLLININVHSQIDTVKIGAFVSSLHDFNLSDNTFKADVYFWCLYQNSDFHFEDEFEIMNTNEVTLEGTSVDTVGSNFWYYTKAKAVVRKSWETENFPFDKQRLVISVESSENDLTTMAFKTDEANCRLSDSLMKQIEEWEILSSRFYTDQSKYNTNFGNPEYDNLSFSSSFNTEVIIKRKDSWLILFKLITGLLVAFIISCCVFFIKPTNTDPRFGLCVGGLFAAIGNKYIVEGIIPPNNKVNMLDNLHNVTFVFIFLIIIISVISLHIYEKGTDGSIRLSQRIDRVSVISIFIAFVTIVSVIIGSYIL